MGAGRPQRAAGFGGGRSGGAGGRAGLGPAARRTFSSRWGPVTLAHDTLQPTRGPVRAVALAAGARVDDTLLLGFGPPGIWMSRSGGAPAGRADRRRPATKAVIFPKASAEAHHDDPTHHSRGSPPVCRARRRRRDQVSRRRPQGGEEGQDRRVSGAGSRPEAGHGCRGRPGRPSSRSGWDLRSGWRFDVGEWFASGEYAKELLASAAEAGVRVFESDERILCYPTIVQISAADATVVVDKMKDRRVRPSVVVAIWKRFNSGPRISSRKRSSRPWWLRTN